MKGRSVTESVSQQSGAVTVRDEEPADHDAIRRVNRAAFPTPAEAQLVDALRLQADPFISLVAETDGTIVGHIAFSPVTLESAADLRLMGLGPMAVLPDRQQQGIGSVLVRAGCERCRQLQATAVVVLGHPQYYPRFGFVPARQFDIDCEYDVPDEAFMLLELVADGLSGRSGRIHYHPAFASV